LKVTTTSSVTNFLRISHRVVMTDQSFRYDLSIVWGILDIDDVSATGSPPSRHQIKAKNSTGPLDPAR
jgi:hypothetical protein